MGGEKQGKRPGEEPVQKGSGSIAKKKPDPKAEAVTTPKARKPKASKGSKDFQDDDALIASLISCATGSEKKERCERDSGLLFFFKPHGETSRRRKRFAIAALVRCLCEVAGGAPTSGAQV